MAISKERKLQTHIWKYLEKIHGYRNYNSGSKNALTPDAEYHFIKDNLRPLHN